MTGVLFGMAPAWRAARVAPNAALKANGRGVIEGHGRFAIGKILVVSQIAISMALLVAAGSAHRHISQRLDARRRVQAGRRAARVHSTPGRSGFTDRVHG